MRDNSRHFRQILHPSPRQAVLFSDSWADGRTVRSAQANRNPITTKNVPLILTT